jgi:hypothetical protein
MRSPIPFISRFDRLSHESDRLLVRPHDRVDLVRRPIFFWKAGYPRPADLESSESALGIGLDLRGHATPNAPFGCVPVILCRRSACIKALIVIPVGRLPDMAGKL